MATIDIGIGHDDNLVITKLFEVQSLAVLSSSDCHAESRIYVLYFLAVENAVRHCLFHIQNLTAQRKDCLEVLVPTLLCRTACRITLDEEKLALFGVAVGAVGQLAGKSSTCHNILALDLLASLACRNTRLCCKNNLINDCLCLVGIFLEVNAKHLAYSLVNYTYNITVTKFCLGLTFELRFGNLDRNDSGKTFAEVIATDFYLCLCQHTRSFSVVLQGSCQTTAETCQVGTTFYRVDVVYKRVKVFCVFVVVLKCNFNRNAVLYGRSVDNAASKLFAAFVKIFNEFAQTIF